MNEKFVATIETLEAAEINMAELWKLMEVLESRKEASFHETQTIGDYAKRLGGMGEVIRSMLEKREKELLEKMRNQQKGESDDRNNIQGNCRLHGSAQ